MRGPTFLILRGELRAIGARGWFFAVRAFWLAAMVGAIWAVNAWGSTSRTAAIQMLMGQMFNLGFVMIGLLMPALVVQMIARDRDSDTLGLLLLTPLRPGSILVQKLVARLWVAVLLVLSPAPLIVALMSSRMLSQELMLTGLVGLAGAVFLGAAGGLAGGAFGGTGWQKWALAYGVTGGGMWLWIIIDRAHWWLSTYQPMMGFDDLVLASLRVTYWNLPRRGVAAVDGYLVAGSALLMGVAVMVMVGRLQRLAEGGMTVSWGVPKWMRASAAWVADLKREGDEWWEWNPVLWIGVRRGRTPNMTGLALLSMVLVAGLVGLGAWSAVREVQGVRFQYSWFYMTVIDGLMGMSLLSLYTVCVWILSVVYLVGMLLVGVTAFDRDRRIGLLELIQASPMSAKRVIMGKLCLCAMRVMAVVWVGVLITLGGYLAVACTTYQDDPVGLDTVLQMVANVLHTGLLGLALLSIALSVATVRERPISGILETLGWVAGWVGLTVVLTWGLGTFNERTLTNFWLSSRAAMRGAWLPLLALVAIRVHLWLGARRLEAR